MNIPGGFVCVTEGRKVCVCAGAEWVKEVVPDSCLWVPRDTKAAYVKDWACVCVCVCACACSHSAGALDAGFSLRTELLLLFVQATLKDATCRKKRSIFQRPARRPLWDFCTKMLEHSIVWGGCAGSCRRSGWTHWGRWGSTSWGGFWGSCSGRRTAPPPPWWRLPVATGRKQDILRFLHFQHEGRKPDFHVFLMYFLSFIFIYLTLLFCPLYNSCLFASFLCFSFLLSSNFLQWFLVLCHPANSFIWIVKGISVLASCPHTKVF